MVGDRIKKKKNLSVIYILDRGKSSRNVLDSFSIIFTSFLK